MFLGGDSPSQTHPSEGEAHTLPGASPNRRSCISHSMMYDSLWKRRKYRYAESIQIVFLSF